MSNHNLEIPPRLAVIEGHALQSLLCAGSSMLYRGLKIVEMLQCGVYDHAAAVCEDYITPNCDCQAPAQLCSGCFSGS